KKGEPKKGEPKKGEPKKGEPKKGEPKKGEPKKGEPKKGEPKKAQGPKQADPKKGKPIKDANKVVDGERFKKFGSMQQLSDRELQRALIETKGAGTSKVKKREVDGMKLIQELNPLERQIFDQSMLAGVKRITQYLDAPKKDGNRYQGVITILLDRQGKVNAIAFKKRSGNDALDEAFYSAVLGAGYLELPSDPDARRAMVTFPLSLTYDESDMAD
ncbi:TonB C-terminal domain-containing protein, partial [Oleiphilus sp. HI0080]